jgi:hypothetical protein
VAGAVDGDEGGAGGNPLPRLVQLGEAPERIA